MSLPLPHHRFSAVPGASGLYDPAFDRDSCGFALVATLRQSSGHDIITIALDALRNLEHRGAVGSDAGTGDGAGIMTQIPDAFFRAVSGFDLPAPGHYAVGNTFLPVDPASRADIMHRIDEVSAEEGLTVIGWRDVPVDATSLGDLARQAMPFVSQLFLVASQTGVSGIDLDRRTYRVRKRIERDHDVYFCSLSCRTLVYKGMVTTLQLEPFYPDLSDDRFESRLALVHSRYSTNTFPSWPLAHPFRFIAHNGEINTVQGNRNWMRARQSQLASPVLGNMADLLPVCTEGASDSASFDEVVELLNLSGRSLPHAIMMMIPEAWENQPDMDGARRAFYEFHSTMMEAWDGPAAMAFTDGTLVGATLDRNGLRPGRYLVTDEGLIVVASEIGVYPVDPSRVVKKGRLQPGKMFLVDSDAGRIVEDDEIKDDLASSGPWADWISEARIDFALLPPREHVVHSPASVARRQRTFGYTEEDLRIMLAPMARTGQEPLGAMGSDTPIAVLAERPRNLFDYFTQQFAQVTNPPLDSIREEVVTSMRRGLGPERNLLDATPEHARQVVVPFPIIDNDQLSQILHLPDTTNGPATLRISGLYRASGGSQALEARLNELCAEVDSAVEAGVSYLILSDRDSSHELAPIPSLLFVSAIHHHLIRQESRMQVSLVVEAGDVREVHHAALLIGYGAGALNPYLAMESVENMIREGFITDVSPEQATKNLIKALGKGVLKIMSKMGISTVSSYSGAQTFEAVGLSQELVDHYFTGTRSRLGGVGIEVIERENALRHISAYPTKAGTSLVHERLTTGGEYQWRRDGAPHLFNPETVFKLQHATREGKYDVFREYTNLVDTQAENLMTLRGLFGLGGKEITPIPLDEVEPVASIVKRFSTGAMSYGSISPEAHETLAIAMNRLGAKSNTGEGGEDSVRLTDPERRSAIKQVASGRFGVTSMYLTHADDIQIKMAQGAKPGEGGQLPPGKMYPWIARTRHSTPGVGLISPPPHHDIYSIEDLKQLIFDLKRSNPSARIHVKLVSQSGIGAVSAGVAKALADVVLISGHDGGTGASPLNSLKHAGTPWELGLAEAQQTLIANDMRDRVVVQVDGQLKTGRDVIVAALLGAEEFGFATAPLVVSGCIMMRVCHLDTCPVGVATQNPELRSRFSGKPEFVINFFEFIAEQVREHLAALGLRSLEEAIGRFDLLNTNRAIGHWKTEGLDLSPILQPGTFDPDRPRRHTRDQDHNLDSHFDRVLVGQAQTALHTGEPMTLSMDIQNTERAVGTLLGHELTKAHGEDGLPTGTIDITLTGSAGQSLGAFMPAGITLRLVGDANDYVGKGLSGGIVVVRQDPRATCPAEDNVIAGNVVGYGATSGSLFINGLVGERFLVRNSGATAVVEGVGDHALEYMTGGLALILGPTGRNLGAGMSGGIAYVHRLNRDSVNSEALSTGEIILDELGGSDREIVRDLLVQHESMTDSALAQLLLAEGDAALDRFVKVTPRDYAAVLQTRETAVIEGLDPDGSETWKRILEVTGG